LGELSRPAAVGPLCDYVTHDRCYAKIAGFHALGRIGDRAAVEIIRPLLDDPNCQDDWYWYGCKSVRAAAAAALLALGDAGGTSYLTELAEADDDVFYVWFAPAILRLPDAPVALTSRLTPEALCGPGAGKVRQTDPARVAMVTEALGLVGGPVACERLQTLTGFRSRYVRGQAVLSLLAADPSDARVAAAEELADGDPTDFVRVKAALALALADRASPVDQIARVATETPESFDRAVAIESLGLLGDVSAEPLLRASLDDPDDYVRRCGVEALDRIGADGIDTLLEDPDELVRLQAARMLAAREKGGRA